MEQIFDTHFPQKMALKYRVSTGHKSLNIIVTITLNIIVVSVKT